MFHRERYLRSDQLALRRLLRKRPLFEIHRRNVRSHRAVAENDWARNLPLENDHLPKGVAMKRVSLSVLKFFALLFMLPGLGGLVFSAMISTSYLESLPKSPNPAELRMTPRNVHGVVIYQTVEEDQRLSAMEYSSVTVFLIGLVLGIIYLEKWSTARQVEMESDLLEEAEA